MTPQFSNCNPHHEADLDLLEHGHGKPRVFASAEANVHLHDAEVKDTSSDGCASNENSLQPTNFLLSHHSTHLQSRRSRSSDSLSIHVSNSFDYDIISVAVSIACHLLNCIHNNGKIRLNSSAKRCDSRHTKPPIFESDFDVSFSSPPYTFSLIPYETSIDKVCSCTKSKVPLALPRQEPLFTYERN